MYWICLCGTNSIVNPEECSCWNSEWQCVYIYIYDSMCIYIYIYICICVLICIMEIIRMQNLTQLGETSRGSGRRKFLMVNNRTEHSHHELKDAPGLWSPVCLFQFCCWSDWQRKRILVLLMYISRHSPECSWLYFNVHTGRALV